MLKQLRESASTIVVDGGDLFFSQPKLANHALEKERVRAKALVQAYNQLSTDVMTVGERDLAGGLDFLLELADSARFPIISANLTDANGNHPLPPSTIIERDGLKWGFIGVSAHQWEDAVVSFDDPIEAVIEQVGKLHSEVDFLTVLFHGNRDQLKELAQSVQDVDLIIQSHANTLRRDLGSGPIPVALLGTEGKYVCTIQVNLDVPGEAIRDISKLKTTLNNAERGLERLKRNQPEDAILEEIYADQPKVLERIAVYKQRIASMTGELDEAVNSVNFEAVDCVNFEAVALSAEIGDDKLMLEFVNQTKTAMGAVGNTDSVEVAQISQ